jgi:tRNA threonylcarbamoyladenosine biosynthesis protein TsaE
MRSTGPEQTRAVARSLARLLEPGDVLLLAGPLGAGKTELTKGLAEGLDVKEPVVSPTFTLAREYQGRLRLLHVDVYRLDTAGEVIDLALDEDEESSVTVVEWGDVAAAVMPTEHLLVRIDLTDDPDARDITFECSGPAWLSREASLAAAMEAGTC